MTETPMKPKSDLAVRAMSAVVMVAVAGTALWNGGWLWMAFVACIALGVLWEWRGLVIAITSYPFSRSVWSAFGLFYIGLAAFSLARGGYDHGLGSSAFLMITTVVAVDVGAYFFGRFIGGPKIAPSISPSKTWSGLLGGAVGAAIAIVANPGFRPLSTGEPFWQAWLWVAILFAVFAQSGDFFESWMKRRAGVKDSGNLIPGHGGLFDRVDGLLAVVFISALMEINALFQIMGVEGISIWLLFWVES